MDSWSKSDDYFVSQTLKVYKYDLSSLLPWPVEMVRPETNVTYDGPDGDDFKSFLRCNNFAVNRQGRVIIRVAQSNDRIEGGGGGYDIFLLEMVVPLGKYGFTNVATPMQETLEAIRDSTKKVFVDVDLKPPAANGDPKSVLIFLKELRDVLDRQKSPVCKPEDVKFPRPRNLKQISKGGNFMDFFCVMNRTFVNEAGTYIELQFVRLASGAILSIRDNVVRYRDKDRAMDDPFQMVQCDMEEDDKLVVVPDYFSPKSSPHVSARTTDDHPYSFIPGLHINIQVEYVDCTLEYNEFKLSGRIKRVRDTENTFRLNAPVTVFFEQSPYAKTCYVDAQASTFFVLAPELDRWKK